MKLLARAGKVLLGVVGRQHPGLSEDWAARRDGAAPRGETQPKG